MLAATGQMAEAEALARTLLREGLDEPTEAQLYRQLALVYLVQGRSHESVAAIERYGELTPEPGVRGRTHAEIAFTRFVDLDHAGARAAAETAIEEGRRVGDLAAQVAGGGVLCWLDSFRNRFPAALERVEQILEMADQPNAAESHLYQPWFMAALVHLESDRLDELAHDVRRGRETAERAGFAWSIPAYDAIAAYGLVRSGDLDDAAAVASSTLGYLEGVDGWGVALWCHAFLAQIAIHRGEDSTGDEHVAIAEEHLTTGRGQFGFEQSMIAKARLAERRNDPASALQILGDTWDIYGTIGVLAGRQAIGPDLVRLSLESGDGARVDAVVADLAEAAATAGTAAFRAFALMAAAQREADGDGAMTAVELMATTPRRLTVAAMLRETASMLRSAGRAADADGCAARSAQLFAECGAGGDAAMVLQSIAGRAPCRRDRPALRVGRTDPDRAARRRVRCRRALEPRHRGAAVRFAPHGGDTRFGHLSEARGGVPCGARGSGARSPLIADATNPVGAEYSSGAGDLGFRASS